MAGDRDFGPDPDDPAIRADQHRLADHAHELAPVHRFLAPGAVGQQHLVFGIGAERDAKLVFDYELVEGGERVGGDAEDRGVGAGKPRTQPGKIHGLAGAARRVSLGVEIQHQILSPEVRERHALPAAAGQFERWRLDSFGQQVLCGRFARRAGCFLVGCFACLHAPSFRRLLEVKTVMFVCHGVFTCAIMQETPRRGRGPSFGRIDD
jgi:hypothetical protein